MKCGVFVDQAPLQNRAPDWELGSRGCYDIASLTRLQELLKYDYVGFAKGNARSCLSTEIDPAHERLLIAETLKAHPEGLGQIMADHTAIDWRPYLRRVRVPCLVLAGGRSQIFPLEGVKECGRLIAASTTVVFEREDHWLYIEDFLRFAELVCDFRVSRGAHRGGRRAPARAGSRADPPGRFDRPARGRALPSIRDLVQDMLDLAVADPATYNAARSPSSSRPRPTGGSPRVSNMGPRVASRAATPLGLPGTTKNRSCRRWTRARWKRSSRRGGGRRRAGRAWAAARGAGRRRGEARGACRWISRTRRRSIRSRRGSRGPRWPPRREKRVARAHGGTARRGEGLSRGWWRRGEGRAPGADEDGRATKTRIDSARRFLDCVLCNRSETAPTNLSKLLAVQDNRARLGQDGGVHPELRLVHEVVVRQLRALRLVRHLRLQREPIGHRLRASLRLLGSVRRFRRRYSASPSPPRTAPLPPVAAPLLSLHRELRLEHLQLRGRRLASLRRGERVLLRLRGVLLALDPEGSDRVPRSFASLAAVAASPALPARAAILAWNSSSAAARWRSCASRRASYSACFRASSSAAERSGLDRVLLSVKRHGHRGVLPELLDLGRLLEPLLLELPRDLDERRLLLRAFSPSPPRADASPIAAMMADCSARTASLAPRRSRFASSSRLNRSTSAATAAAIAAFSSLARCLRRSMRDICLSSSRRCAATARRSSALISACCLAYTSCSKRDMTAQSLLDCSPTLRVTPPSEGRPVREAAYFGGGARVDGGAGRPRGRVDRDGLGASRGPRRGQRGFVAGDEHVRVVGVQYHVTGLRGGLGRHLHLSRMGSGGRRTGGNGLGISKFSFSSIPGWGADEDWETTRGRGARGPCSRGSP